MPHAQRFSHLLPLLTTLPSTPGVYQMRNSQGKIIYVGKAKNLKSRVNSYFLRPEDLNPAKKQMVCQVKDIEITLTSTEIEALVLETNLIKHLRPKYNILMKDDKNLSYIKITKNPVPEIIRTRKKNADGGQYFGPYVSNISMILRYIRRLFRVRACRVQFALEKEKLVVTDRAGRTLPCMDYYIGLCPAPCLLQDKNLREHTENLEKARDFLRGRFSDVIHTLEEQMKEKAKNLDFEGAQELKDILTGVRNIMESQNVRDKIEGNHDIAVLYEKNNHFFGGITQIRESQVIANLRFEIESKLEMTYEEILADFLASYYIENEEISLPDTLILDRVLDDESLLSYFQEKKIQIIIPKQGPRLDLLAFTRNQLREYAYKSELATLEQKTLTRGHMVNILDRLRYPIPKSGPIRFECYDISHTHGYFTVASRVVIENGKTKNSDYKKYSIKTLQKGEIDDFASLKEVMFRRTLEGLELGNFPHLIIIDGGKGQLSHAIEGIQMGVHKFLESGKEETNGFFAQSEFLLAPLSDAPSLCSLAKRDEEVFLPGNSEPILFQKGTPELMVLQKARDESHRFSITANRQSRTKAMKKNLLEELPGFGPTTRKKLLRLAGSVEEIRSLSEESLLSVCTRKQIETLRDHGLL